MPEGAVYVGRPTKWGNPYKTQDYGLTTSLVLYRRQLPPSDIIRRELAGKDLVCWCPLYRPCHADILLDLANDKA